MSSRIKIVSFVGKYVLQFWNILMLKELNCSKENLYSPHEELKLVWTFLPSRNYNNLKGGTQALKSVDKIPWFSYLICETFEQ